MATRIADDPDSWGKPEDLQKRDAPEQAEQRLVMSCPLCGVPWGMHDMVACKEFQRAVVASHAPRA